MSIYAASINLAKAQSEYPTSDLLNPQGWLTQYFGGKKTASGVRVTDDNTIGLSAIFDGVRLLAESEAQLPLKIYRTGTDGNKTPYRNHPAFRLIYREPNPMISSYNFRKMMVKHRIFAGNAFAVIERNARFAPVALWPVEPYRVNIQIEDGKIVYIVDGGMKLDSDHMLHILGYSENGYTGIPLVRLAAESLGHMIATERFGGRFFGNGANISGIIKTKKYLDNQDAVDRVKRSFTAQASGLENAMSVAMLEDGMDWERLGVAPEEAQFLQTRQFNITDVARWLNIPVPMLKEMGRATFSNLEQLDIQFVKYSLQPNLINSEMEYERKLLTTAERQDPDIFVKHNVKGLLRGDTKAQAEWYKSLTSMGAYSPNDVLRHEDEDTFEGGDTHFVHSGAIPVETAINQQANER
jgi:HK97 family phage portal protein